MGKEEVDRRVIIIHKNHDEIPPNYYSIQRAAYSRYLKESFWTLKMQFKTWGFTASELTHS